MGQAIVSGQRFLNRPVSECEVRQLTRVRAGRAIGGECVGKTGEATFLRQIIDEKTRRERGEIKWMD